MNSLKLTSSSGSKSLVLTPSSNLEARSSSEDQAYHSLNATSSSHILGPTFVPNISFEDESNKVGSAPIYESIDHPDHRVQTHPYRYAH